MLWGIEQHSYSIIAIAGKKMYYDEIYGNFGEATDGEFVNCILERWAFLRKLGYKTPLPFFFLDVHLLQKHTSYPWNNDSLVDILLGPSDWHLCIIVSSYTEPGYLATNWKLHGVVSMSVHQCKRGVERKSKS